jgi:mannose-6-phosphate isomerase-like protein (cupin superfamily)
MAQQGIFVQSGEDRTGHPFDFLDARFTVVLSGADTGGAACAVITDRKTKGGPPLHVHPDQDEWYLVQEGRFEMRVGEDTFRLGPGAALLAPRGVPHSFASVTDRARMLVTFLPAGDMEAFFREASALAAPTPPEMAAVFGRHGMQVLGPPLPV